MPHPARALALLAAFGALALTARPGAAQDLTAALDRIDHLAGSDEELAGWMALGEEKFVRAREIAERILRPHPDSYAACFILGVAFHYGEGDLARSKYWLERAARLFEATFTANPPSEAPTRWHEATLRELASTLGEMDRPAPELEVLDKYDRAGYLPKRLAQRVWPLMKLRRYDESRRAARDAVASGNPQQRMIARSDLCAAECEAGDRERAFAACVDALSDFHAPGSGGQVEYSNASEAALSVLRYDDCERYLHEAAQRATPDSWTNPFQHLAELYMLEARVPEAIEAVRGAQDLRMRRPAWLEQHGAARLDGTISELFLLVGITDRAVRAAERAVARPDRQGVQSGTEAQAASASAIRLAVALRDQAAREEEAAVTSGFLDGLRQRASALWHRLGAWRARRRAAVMLASEDFLMRSLRPYYVGSIDLPFWLVPEAVTAVGAGVARSALARARALEPLARARPYFDALEAQALYSAGDCAAVEQEVPRVLSELPAAEALVRGRLAALAAECARRRGDLSLAGVHYQAVLARDPGVLRRMDLALPVTLEDDGTALGRTAAKLIARSPRFESRRDARFRVVVRGATPEACLLGPSGEQVACARVNLPVDVTAEAGARLLAAEFARAAFALKADLTQADLTSLDGSPTAARADRQVQSLIDVLGEGDGPGGRGRPAPDRGARGDDGR